MIQRVVYKPEFLRILSSENPAVITLQLIYEITIILNVVMI